MNTIQEALSKAGVNSEDFKANEKSEFSGFPFLYRWRAILPQRSDYMKDTFGYKRGHKSKLLELWVENQNSTVINFLRKNKDRVYIFPTDKCNKLLQAWIGYNSKYQKFVLRLNPSILADEPEYKGKLPSLLCKANGIKMDEVDYSIGDLFYKLPCDKVPDVIKKLFSSSIIPVERFDPILETNVLVSKSMITAESINLEEIRRSLEKQNEENNVLDATKIHKNAVELYCKFNNIKPIDVYGVTDRRDWINLVFAKDTEESRKTRHNRSFFIVL